MCRFAPQAFLQQMALQERVGISRAAQDTRAVLRALDRVLPTIFREQLHAELASLWGPLTRRTRWGDGELPRVAEGPQPIVNGGG